MKSVILLVVEMLHIGMWVCISETLSKRQVSFRESMGNDIVAIVAIWLSYLCHCCHHINGADNSTNQIQKQILKDFETIGF